MHKRAIVIYIPKQISVLIAAKKKDVKYELLTLEIRHEIIVTDLVDDLNYRLAISLPKYVEIHSKYS